MKKVLYLFLLVAALSTVSDRSFGDNTGLITIYSPAVGVTWVRGNHYDITWTYDHSYNVKIELLRTGRPDSLLIASTPNSSWHWEIPVTQTPGTYRIKITSVYNALTTTTSGDFTIAVADPDYRININTPAVGVEWVKDASNLISWSSTLPAGTVKIELLNASHVPLGDISASVSDLPGGTFSWPTNEGFVTAGDFYYIKITSNQFGTVSRESGLFKIIAANPTYSININTPAIGVEWIFGGNNQISWSSTLPVGTVKIELLNDAHVKVGDISVSEPDLPGGTKSWNANNGFVTPDNYYYIKITSNEFDAVSRESGLFKIVATDPNKIITVYSPALGVQWVWGLPYNITWTGKNVDGNYKIELYDESQVFVKTIVNPFTSVAGESQTFSWTINDVGGAIDKDQNYYIKISSLNPPTTYRWSGVFRIVEKDPAKILTVYTPAIGVEWIFGSTKAITWTDMQVTGNVNIDLYDENRALLGSVISGTANSLHSYSWLINNKTGIGGYTITPGKNYFIKITSVDFPTTYAWSGVFKISGVDPNYNIAIYTPACGVSWVDNSMNIITWESDFSGPVKMDLYTNTNPEVFVYPVVASTPNDGTYAWTIPSWIDVPTILGNFKIKMTGVSSATIKNGGDRLVATQNGDGGWGWPLAGSSAVNTIGPITKGLIQAYNNTLSASQLAAINKTKAFLLAKANNFSPSDGYLSKAIDDLLGGTTCMSYVNANYYTPLANGTYNKNGLGILYTTESYIQKIIDDRAAGGIANMAAWDIGMGLVGAASCGVGTELGHWISGTETKINELNSSDYYDVLGLAGALYGLAFVQDNAFTASAGSFNGKTVPQLADILASYQISNGGFAWNSAWVIPNDGDEAIQETSYAILALNELNRAAYINNILGAADYLSSVQLATGGWSNYQAPNPITENNEVTGEALWGYSVAYQPGLFAKWSCPFSIVKDGKKIADGPAEDALANNVIIYPNPATDKINITASQNINHVLVMNNLGAIVLESKPNSASLSLNISVLNQGIYFVKVETDGTVTTSKIMVK